MKKLLILLPLLLAAPFQIHAQKQTDAPVLNEDNSDQLLDDPSAKAGIMMRDIMSMNLDDNVIPQNARSDLSSCDATGGEPLLKAFRTCWPVQEPMLAYKTIKEKMRIMMRSGPPENPDEILAEILAEADKIINLSKDRTYPAQDVSLVLGHTIRGAMAEKTGDYKTAADSMDIIVTVMQSSRMTVQDFDASAKATEKRDNLRRKMTDSE